MTPPLWTILILVLAAAVLMFIESSGVRTELFLTFKGDVKRESRFLAQWGQLVCTMLVAILVVQLDPDRSRKGRMVAVVVGVVLASTLSTIIKRSLGRVRPGRRDSGRFLGPSFQHANFRESFPSSHSACALALSVGLAWMYPPAAITFWALAIICGLLRYMLDAHWPSDVLGGFALGYGCAIFSWWFFVVLHPHW